MEHAIMSRNRHHLPVLADVYIEALLVNQNLADQVWELWDAGVITDEIAAAAWCIVTDEIGYQCPES